MIKDFKWGDEIEFKFVLWLYLWVSIRVINEIYILFVNLEVYFFYGGKLEWLICIKFRMSFKLV